MKDEIRRKREKPPINDLLTTRQLQIFELVAKGKTSKEIADELYLTGKTVENHRNNMCDKLDLEGWGELYRCSHGYFSENS